MKKLCYTSKHLRYVWSKHISSRLKQRQNKPTKQINEVRFNLTLISAKRTEHTEDKWTHGLTIEKKDRQTDTASLESRTRDQEEKKNQSFWEENKEPHYEPP